MFLVLCSGNDTSALWAYQQLRLCGIPKLQLVTSNMLAYARWDHRVGAVGNSIRIHLPDGRVVDGAEVNGTLNRLCGAGTEQTKHAAEGDREYAFCELNAFYTSWLRCLSGDVMNCATPQGLSGRWRHDSEWAALASEAAVPFRTYRQSDKDPAHDVWTSAGHSKGWSEPSHKVIVFRDRLFGDRRLRPRINDGLRKGLIRLAAMADLQMMGAQLELNADGKYLFAGATPLPDLTIGGTPLIQSLAKAWLMKG